MEPLVAQAYEALLRAEPLAGVSLVARDSIRQEVAAGNTDVCRDLEEFNRLVQELTADLDKVDLAGLKERLIFIRIQAMNVESAFSNLADAIAQVFVDTASHDV